MFGFGKRISLQEKAQWETEINALLEREAYEMAVKRVKEYEKADKAAAAFFYALMYFQGIGVKQKNMEKALSYIETYVEKYPEDVDGWYEGSSMMLAAGRLDDATDWLGKVEALGKQGITKPVAEFHSFLGMRYYNTAFVTLKAGERTSMNKKAMKHFTKALQRYGQLYIEEQETLTEEDWIQVGYNLSYLQDITLNNLLQGAVFFDADIESRLTAYYGMELTGADSHTSRYWEQLAERILTDMRKSGCLVSAAYTQAMLAANKAGMTTDKEDVERVKQYLDQAIELSGEKDERYREEYQQIWKNYERMVWKMEHKKEKKGFFSGRKG